ncbi:hypothetical protein PMX22_10110 [Clostridium butyricum]|uniref:hypothetical protein n=1 Tax=Clostridium butyricum TaxID=1492 RepID=UPI00232F32CD|nr:hypothetical protein [Clostridium butyricum]MDB2160155.1 hypothetical protein [Clostridium butyricum]
MAVKTVSKKRNKKEMVVDNTFKFDEIISQEERAVMYGVANGQEFDVKDINEQLRVARDLK